MHLRRKALVIIVVLVASVVLTLYGSAELIVGKYVAETEEEHARNEVGRALNLLSNQLANLDSFAADWATWDDTYRYVADSNSEYAESNLVGQTFLNLKINLLAIVNSSGSVVFSEAFDLSNATQMPIPSGLEGMLSSTSILVLHASTQSKVVGLVVVDGTPALIASRPILTSDAQGPIRGALVMGIFLGTSETSRLSETFGEPIALSCISGSNIPSDFATALMSLSESSPIMIHPLNEERIAGYALLNDIYGEPALVLRIDEPRIFYRQSQTILQYLAMSLFVGAVIFGAATLLSLERLILSPLAILDADIKRITSSGQISARVSAAPGDEFRTLAGSINMMLDTRQMMEKQTLAEHYLSTRLAAVHSLDEALPACLDTILQVSGMDSGGIYLIDQISGDLNLAYHKGLSNEFVKAVSHFEGDSDRGRFVKAGRPIYTRYDEIGLESPEAGHRENIHAIAIIPVLHENQIVACLNVASHTLTEVPLSSRRGMEAIAAQLGNVLVRVQAQESLRESESRYRMLFDNASDAILILGMDGRFLEANKIACDRLGYTRQELLQMTPVDIATSSPEEVAERVNQIRRLGHTFFEMAHVRRDRTIFPVESSNRMIEYEGRPAILSTARDITKRKEAEEALRISETKYRVLFEKIPHGIYQTTPEGRLLTVNPALVQLLGYDSASELLAVDIENDLYVNPEQRRKWLKELEIRGEIRDAELYLKRKDGAELTVLDNAHLVYDDQGELLYHEGTLTDITGRKRMEKELALYSEHLQELVDERTKRLTESERRFRELADLLPQIVFETNHKGNFTFANRSGLAVTGYTQEDLASGLNALQLFASGDQSTVQDRIGRILAGEPSKGTEYSVVRKDGSAFPVIMHIAPVILGNRVVGLRGIAIDISDRKMMEAQVVKSERLAAIGETVMMVGHDLRNPLQVMMNSLALWEHIRDSMPSDCRDYADKHGFSEVLDRVERQLNYMNKIVSDLQDYARPVKPEVTTLDLSEFMRETLSTISIPKNIKVSVESPEKLMIKLDPALMRRVFTNLLTNAIQAMSNGGSLAVVVSTKEGSAAIDITDTGVGIPEDNLAKVFQPLFTTKAKGQGLGLPVCKRFVEAHGGEITLKSKTGLGTTFTVSLPLR